MFAYMYHGSYSSYYAIPHFASTTPHCGNPLSFDGPNQLVQGDCETGANCLDPTYEDKGKRRTLWRQFENHYYHENLDGGIDPTDPPRLNAAASIVNNSVRLVSFRKPGEDAPAPVRHALVYVVRVDPALAEPPMEGYNPDIHRPFEFAIGHEVARTTRQPDRNVHNTHLSGNVLTVANDRTRATLLVRVSGSNLVKYNIMLRR
jgi:hypothetical protein